MLFRSLGDLAVDGNDLIAELGAEPGPVLGHVLRELLERVVADPALNDRPTLLVLAQALLAAEQLILDGRLEANREARYAGWSGPLGQTILSGETTLEALEARVASGELDPRPVSGRQELLENVVNQAIWRSTARATETARG